MPRMLRSVDFPAPEGPMMVTNTSGWMSRVMRRRTKNLCAPASKDFSMFFNWMRGCTFAPYLFVAQGDHWIDLGGSQRRDAARQQSRHQQYGRNRAKCREVDYADIVEQAVHRAANKISTTEAEDQPQKSQDHAFLENEGENAALPRTECHAQPDFMRSLCHGKGHHTVNSQRCKQQCHPGEAPKQKSRKAISGHGFFPDLIHRLDLGERQIGIHRQDNIRNAFTQGGWIDGCSHRDAGFRPGALPEGHVNLGEALSLRTAIADVMVDTDDLPFDGRTQLADARNQLFDEYPLRQRIDTVKIALRECLVHHGHGKTASQILVRE